MEYTETEKQCIAMLENIAYIPQKIKALSHGVPSLKIAEALISARKNEEEQLLEEYIEKTSLNEQMPVLKTMLEGGTISRKNPFTKISNINDMPIQYWVVGNGAGCKNKYRMLDDWTSFPDEFSMALSCSTLKNGRIRAHFESMNKEEQYKDKMTLAEVMLLPEITRQEFSDLGKPAIFQKIPFCKEYRDRIMETVGVVHSSDSKAVLFVHKSKMANNLYPSNTLELTTGGNIMWVSNAMEEVDNRTWSKMSQEKFGVSELASE